MKELKEESRDMPHKRDGRNETTRHVLRNRTKE